jgi:hypothetical protein
MNNNDVTNRFVLKFNSNIGRVVRISIPRACTEKIAANAQASMEAIIENGAVAQYNRGTPTSIKTAQLVTTERRTVI